MGSTGAARRREQEQPAPEAGAAAEAELRRVIADADAVIGRMRRRDDEIGAIIAALAEMGSSCGNAERFAALADKIATRQSLQVVEMISCARHVAEAREAAGPLTAAVAFSRAMSDALIAEGRRREAEERDEQARTPRPRHARGRHLKVAGGAAVKATAVAAAAVTATTMIASRDSASVRHLAAPRPAAVRFHLARPDSAVLVPQAGPSSPRPSAAAASASPAVTVTPRVPVSSPPPAPSPSPSASPPAPAVPVLSVPRFLDLGGSIRGELPLTAGAQPVTWTATATDGITLSSYGGVVLAGQQVTLTVTDPAGGGGWVYISAGTQTLTVHITSGLGSPVLS